MEQLLKPSLHSSCEHPSSKPQTSATITFQTQDLISSLNVLPDDKDLLQRNYFYKTPAPSRCFQKLQESHSELLLN